MAKATGKKGTAASKTPAKRATDVKTSGKAAATKSAPAKKAMAKGDYYVCEVCGLAVTVDEACGCAEVCEITCCEQPMMKTRKARAAKK
jgi:hypothetical protein